MPQRPKFIALTDDLYDYMRGHGHNRDPLLEELAEETAKLGRISAMQISTEEGTFLSVIVRAMGVRSAVEVGTFTGYSSVCIARALPPDGRLLCCDVSEEWTAIARKYWERASVANKITLNIGPALETLRALPVDTRFDLAFIDANKSGYRGYYEECLKRLRTDGLILIDNVLWAGKVLDASDSSEDTVAIREFNDFVAADKRVEAVMIPVADGITMARKK